MRVLKIPRFAIKFFSLRHRAFTTIQSKKEKEKEREKKKKREEKQCYNNNKKGAEVNSDVYRKAVFLKGSSAEGTRSCRGISKESERKQK